MTFEPQICGDIGKCPLGYSLRKQENVPGITGDCGHRCCYPTACAKNQWLEEMLKNEGEKK